MRVEEGIDLATDEGCTALAARLAGLPLDLVIHNAGVLTDESLGSLDADAAARIRLQFEVNALAPLRLTALLAPQLASGAMLHPGFVQTPMTGGRGDVDAATAARNLLARIDELTLAASGSFLHANGSSLPW